MRFKRELIILFSQDDYLSEYEVLKMKELYHTQLQELQVQAMCHLAVGYAATFPIMGPMLRSSTHNWILRLPLTLTLTTFLAV